MAQSEPTKQSPTIKAVVAIEKAIRELDAQDAHRVLEFVRAGLKQPGAVTGGQTPSR
jgi:hypothetical protein